MNTINELLEFRSYAHPDRVAVSFEGENLSYRQLNQYANKVANLLKNHHLQKGDRIGILDFNTLELQHLLYGASKLGVIPIILNWRLTINDMIYILNDSDVSMFFYGLEFIGIGTEIELSSKILKKELSINEFEYFKDEFIQEERIYPDDIFIQLYTSGTTGIPKGVPLTHKNILSVVTNLAIELPGFGADTINLVCAPFFHIGGVGYTILGHFIGGENVLVKKFDPIAIAKIMEEKKITNVLFVPAMINAIIKIPDIEKYDFSKLRNIQYGGSPISLGILENAVRIFKCNFTKAYGLTETSGIASLLRYDVQRNGLLGTACEVEKKRLASVGTASLGMKLIIKLENGNQAEPNELGEVCIKGDYLFSGYWNRTELNKISFDKDGWFYTGDIGLMDADGYLFLYDRKNDMILSKSENIYPVEVEQILSSHPNIVDIAIVGLPDENFGEIVTAFIVVEAEKTISLSDLKAFALNKLANFKIPKKLLLVAEIPRNPSGKILRNELKERIQNLEASNNP